MRTYEKTHPWLKFTFNLSAAPATLWVMLGECQSKCEHISWAPLLPEIQGKLHQLYLAKGSLATTAIEGNTLSEKEVLLHLEKKLHLPPSKEYLAREISNIVDACNDILENVVSRGDAPLSVDLIKEFNAKALKGLTLDEDVAPGEFRMHSVGVSRYKAPPAEDCELLMDVLCDWLNGPVFMAPPNMKIVYALIRAILAHLYVAWIHPFGDGNGRTARLLEFRILIASGVPAPAAHLLSNHYNQTRSEYYRQLDRASGSGGDVIPFLMYAVQGFLDGLRDQLEEIRNQQREVVWRDYVWKNFREKTSPADVRRRQLVFALSAAANPIAVSRIPEIDAKLARAYADKTDRTISRDVNELVRMGLVTKTGKKVLARKEAIFGFLPVGASVPETWNGFKT